MSDDLIVPAAAMAISVISLCSAIYFGRAAQEHNRKSVLPIPYLDRSDFENQLQVRLYNKGTGPMIVTELAATHENGESGPLVDIVPDAPVGFMYSNFSRFTEPRTIRPGDFNDLLVASFELDADPYAEFRETLRHFLKDVTVHCKYTDVYDSSFEPYDAECSWFGRHYE